MMENSIPNKVITLESLEEMFLDISEKTPWDMESPMLWGYFFTDNDPKLLEKAKTQLIPKGYRFVDLFLADKEEKEEPDLWFLHVEVEEIHTPKSLDKRNNELYLFASELGLQSYDGMDVGPIKN